jgi:hypothetical protein
MRFNCIKPISSLLKQAKAIDVRHRPRQFADIEGPAAPPIDGDTVGTRDLCGVVAAIAVQRAR